MPTSEIDDIFSAKGKAKAVESLLPLPPDVKKEKKKKKRKDKHHAGEQTNEIEPSSQPKKRSFPETVVDPSFKSSSSSKRPKLDASAPSRLIKPSHKEDEDHFKNSRGSGPRMFLFFFFLSGFKYR